MSLLQVDCRRLPPEDRVAFYDQSVARLSDFSTHTEPLGSEPLVAVLDKRTLGDLSIFCVSGEAQRVHVRWNQGYRGLAVLLPRSGGGWIQAQKLAPLTVHTAYLLGWDVGQSFQLILPANFRHLSLHLPAATVAFAREFVDGRGFIALALNAIGAVFSDLVESAFEHAGSIAPGSIHAVEQSLMELFHSLLSEAMQSSMPAPSRLESYHRRRIREHVLRHLGEADLDVHAIADAVKLSARHVHQLFSSEAESLMRWVWSQRLEHCRRQLESARTRGVRISDVAYDWGFSDANHFSRIFRQTYGMSPTQYLDSLQRPMPPSLQGHEDGNP